MFILFFYSVIFLPSSRSCLFWTSFVCFMMSFNQFSLISSLSSLTLLCPSSNFFYVFNVRLWKHKREVNPRAVPNTIKNWMRKPTKIGISQWEQYVILIYGLPTIEHLEFPFWLSLLMGGRERNKINLYVLSNGDHNAFVTFVGFFFWESIFLIWPFNKL